MTREVELEHIDLTAPLLLLDRGYPHVPSSYHHLYNFGLFWICAGLGGNEVHQGRGNRDC